MSDLLQRVDERTQLAGTNKLEILMFSIDGNEDGKGIYAINVFKIREVMSTPVITALPGMPPSVIGMVSLRGALVPVIDLPRYTGKRSDGISPMMIVTEYNNRVQAFLVDKVDNILRLDWSQMRVPPEMLQNQSNGLINAITELQDGRLVMMLDVEKILADLTPETDLHPYGGIPQLQTGKSIWFADDSQVARNQIAQTLEAMGARYNAFINGKQLWERLDKEGRAQPDSIKNIGLIITDVEMPEMDGYILTRTIKADPRFRHLPILMHSSLSGNSNQQLGMGVGVDEYIPKFEPHRLAEIVQKWMAKT